MNEKQINESLAKSPRFKLDHKSDESPHRPTTEIVLILENNQVAGPRGRVHRCSAGLNAFPWPPLIEV